MVGRGGGVLSRLWGVDVSVDKMSKLWRNGAR